MAETKVELTWQEKLDQGIPLTAQEEVKADADYNYRQRLEDEARRKEFEERKRGFRLAKPNPAGENLDTSESSDTNDKDNKGGKK